MKNTYHNAHNHYKSIELQTRMGATPPHELVHLLLQGARSNIAIAQGYIQRKQISEKGTHISKAISIIGALKTNLDLASGGEIADNLNKLYDYIMQILLKANRHNDMDLLTEANQLLTELHEGWQGIKPE
ncbi:flagellar export chaperone FliS [Legionella fairfieldensis]|uniref:flagellar export chaperone FliS n=1 Tax=Legionella fairfieldensis TaxID=45064 RepID=UPI00048C1420|nr:flagellar export chaperone FliS [Legionella fairfieldensis]